MDQARPMQKGPGLILCVPDSGQQHGKTRRFVRGLPRGFIPTKFKSNGPNIQKRKGSVSND